MSHIVQIQTEVRDPIAIQSACRRLNFAESVHGTVKLFSTTATGWAITLPRWRFPIVCNTDTGKVEFDNFNGQWGDRKQLDRFLQAYAVERASIEARRKGHSVTEQQLADGSIKLTIQVAGGVA